MTAEREALDLAVIAMEDVARGALYYDEPVRKALLACRTALAAPQACTTGVLYEHEDGRYAVSPGDAPAAFSNDDPRWHRVGSVDLSALAAPPVEQAAHPTEVVPAADARDDELLDDATSPGNGNKAKRRAALIAAPPSPTEQPATQAGAKLVEAVTKAILFADCGSTEDWRDNTDLGEAAIRACNLSEAEWRELFRLREAVKGPDGYATWQEAATSERVRRVKAERELADHPTEQPREDAALLDWLREHSCDLRCIDAPTGAGDGDIHWVVIEHYMSAPHEREIGRAYDDDPREAIRAAQAQAKGGA
jgi:hypothetical protein